jgi:hypothetical protein
MLPPEGDMGAEVQTSPDPSRSLPEKRPTRIKPRTVELHSNEWTTAAAGRRSHQATPPSAKPMLC